MRKRVIAAVVTTAIALAAAPAVAAQSRQDLTPEARGAYVSVAGAIDLYEIRAAELALEKARRADVRAFAETMLAEHRRASEDLLEKVRSAGMEVLEPAMMPMHWDMLRRLERASGSRFDGVYAEQQVEAHEDALELHRNFAANGHGPQLKAHAEAMVPTATRHLQQAQRLDR